MSDLEKKIQDSSKKLREIEEKKFAITEARVNYQYEDLEKREKERKAFTELKIRNPDVSELVKQNREYIDLAKKGSVFLGIEDFNGVIPMFARNLIMIAANTGTGKSTTSANITLQAIQQNKRVLVITNEENITDVLNRIIFLTRGWNYSDHSKITEEQKNEMDRMYPILTQRISILTDQSNGVGGTTTTLEGIEAVLEAVQNDEKKYDVIILDYIQNVVSSVRNPAMEQWKVIDRVGKIFDQFKNNYNAPVVIFSQLKQGDAPFKERIEKCKSFLNSMTCAIEVAADFEKRLTKWTIQKARFNGTIGREIYTGYDRGRYVKHCPEWDIENEKNKLRNEIKEKAKKDGFSQHTFS